MDTIWIDLETKLPIEREIVQTTEDPFTPSSGKIRMVDSDYVYNPAMPDSLFSLKTPEGYTVEEQEYSAPKVPDEKEFIAGLRLWAEDNGGQFPEELTMLKLITLKFEGDMKKISTQLQTINSQVLGFARYQYQQKREWRYWGNGVKLGDKNKLVYWYQPSADKPFRVIYGDLSVKDIPENQLPTTQPATQPAAK